MRYGMVRVRPVSEKDLGVEGTSLAGYSGISGKHRAGTYTVPVLPVARGTYRTEYLLRTVYTVLLYVASGEFR